MSKVNLFVVGAPKCGTTALATYLSKSEEVFFPGIKEPHYFCDDFSGIRRVKTEKQYLSLYSDSRNEGVPYRGDASVWYLYSKEAAEKIHEYNCEAKIIIMIRNPLTMLPSLHNQLLFSGREDESDFVEAWGLCRERKAGLNIPKNSIEPSHLYYDEVCKYYEQIERYRERFPANNIKIVVFEDFVADVPGAMAKIYDFLGIRAPAAVEYEVVNQAREHRYPRVMRFLQYPPFPISTVKSAIKKIGFVRKTSPLRGVYSYFSVKKKVDANVEAVSESVMLAYNDDLLQLKDVLGIDLKAYKLSNRL